MQIPYHINTSLANYYHAFRSGKWAIPDFSKECLLCGRADCARYWGFYTRRVVEPTSGFAVADFPVMRFRCFRPDGTLLVLDVTFSLLPLDLVPYRRLSLTFMVLAILVRVKRKLSWVKTEAKVDEELVDMEEDVSFVSVAALLSWACLLWDGFLRLAANKPSGLCLLDGRLDDGPGNIGGELFTAFLEGAREYLSKRLEPRIRGPDALAGDFYLQSGGWQVNAAFLFGTASQHRKGIGRRW